MLNLGQKHHRKHYRRNKDLFEILKFRSKEKKFFSEFLYYLASLSFNFNNKNERIRMTTKSTPKMM